MWNDSTRYSQGDKQRTPTSFSARSGSIDITVPCDHLDHKGQWIMHCKTLGIKEYPLDATNREDTQQKATVLVKAKLERMLKDLEGINALSHQ